MSFDPLDPDHAYPVENPQEKIEMLNKPFDGKKNCWIPDTKQGYVAAKIESTKGDYVTVLTESMQTVTVKKDKIQQMNPPKYYKNNDMADLMNLNEDSVLNNVRTRYKDFMIYAFSGLLCMVINP